MERIEINGVWYVREDSQLQQTPPLTEEDVTYFIGEDDVTHFKGIAYECDNYCFEASKLTKHQELDDVVIEITFKERGISPKEWKTESWDHIGFFQGILENNLGSIDSVREGFNEDSEGVRLFKAFLVYLQKIHWL